jgi:hypothetical protein
MSTDVNKGTSLSRRDFSVSAGLFLFQLGVGVPAGAADAQSVDARFDYLSTHGNSNCSTAFLNSIAKMPVTARLQGSCCSPMERRHYADQVRDLTKYNAIPEIPPDPYDIAAGLAQKLMPNYDLTLNPKEQRAYQYAMENSEEKGPCCCRCWRWKMYGGLAKNLIRKRRFSGLQVVDVWNLSDGCGGGAEDDHG